MHKNNCVTFYYVYQSCPDFTIECQTWWCNCAGKSAFYFTSDVWRSLYQLLFCREFKNISVIWTLGWKFHLSILLLHYFLTNWWIMVLELLESLLSYNFFYLWGGGNDPEAIHRVIQKDCRGFNNLSYSIHLR